MQPVIVMPMNDPSGLLFQHLRVIAPTLKNTFAHAFVSVSASTQKAQPGEMVWLRTDDFFQVIFHEKDLPVGDDFLALYTHAAHTCYPEQVAHLCFLDRVAFALQSDYREQFIADIQAASREQTPLIFHRSTTAWETHPSNYRDIEQFLTYVGERLFNRTLDFAWCHFAVGVHHLREILPHVHNHDISMCAEMVILLQSKIQTKQVDWLAWEDPFIFSRDAQQLKSEREHSPQETRKRLSYAVPMLQLLYSMTNGRA